VVLVCFGSTAQKRFKVTAGAGIGSYKMADLKKLQEDITILYNREYLETVDNFPMYFFYSGEISYDLNKSVGVGLIYRLQSTGAASSYSDYSGVYKIEQRLKANCMGILFDFNLWEKNKLRLSSQIRIYYSWTNMELTEYLHLTGIDNDIVDLRAEFISKSIMTNPDVTVGYEVFDNVLLNLSAGYCIDFQGDLKNKTNNSPLNGFNGYPLQSDWSGIRMNLSAAYRF
jgi:hypothetical protein